MANGSTGRPLDVVTAAQALASLLLEGLSDHDLADFARRLLPHLHEGRPGRTRARCAYTVASLAAELGVSDKAIRCAITRHELRGVKRGSRWIISADAVDEWATAPDVHPARARRRPLRSLPLPKRQVPRAQFSAERVKRHAAKLAGARDERRENNAGEWRRRLACALGGSTAGTVREPSALAATPATSTRRSGGSAVREASQRLTPAPRLWAST